MICGDVWIRSHPELVEPFHGELVNPASYDVRLGYTFLMPRRTGMNRLGAKVQYKRYEVKEGESILIGPGEFMLATTIEYIRVPDDMACFVHGRSSVGRMGLSVQNAGFVDAGFEGCITLELKNESAVPIELLPTYPVAQLVWMNCTEVSNPYNGKYLGQREATGSLIGQDSQKYGDLFPQGKHNKRRTTRSAPNAPLQRSVRKAEVDIEEDA